MSSNLRIVIFTILGTLTAVGLIAGAYVLGARSVATPIAANFQSETPQSIASPSPSPQQSLYTIPSPTPANVNSNQTVAPTTPKPLKKRTKESGTEYGWKYYTETQDSPTGYYYFYQPSSITKRGDRVTAWLRQYVMYPAAYGKKNKMPSVDYVLERITFDCDNDSYFVDDETYFDLDGSSIPQRRGYQTYHSLVPGTTLKSMAFIICLEAM